MSGIKLISKDFIEDSAFIKTEISELGSEFVTGPLPLFFFRPGSSCSVNIGEGSASGGITISDSRRQASDDMQIYYNTYDGSTIRAKNRLTVRTDDNIRFETRNISTDANCTVFINGPLLLPIDAQRGDYLELTPDKVQKLKQLLES